MKIPVLTSPRPSSLNDSEINHQQRFQKTNKKMSKLVTEPSQAVLQTTSPVNQITVGYTKKSKMISNHLLNLETQLLASLTIGTAFKKSEEKPSHIRKQSLASENPRSPNVLELTTDQSLKKGSILTTRNNSKLKTELQLDA